jgi:hypothetical protein
VPLFVHIADERDSASIKRSGLRLAKGLLRTDSGIFAMPVISNFVLTHQWVRELKRQGYRTAVGVYFRIPKDQTVLVGQYNETKVSCSASEAAARFRSEQKLGFETIIPRSIQPREVHAIRALPQTLGWRYFPGAHEKGIFCGCAYCTKGEYKSKSIRERWDKSGALQQLAGADV